MQRTRLWVSSVACIASLAWVYYAQGDADAAYMQQSVLPRIAEALLDVGMSTMLFFLVLVHAHYWKTTVRNKVLPIAISLLVAPYVAITWPAAYTFDVFLQSAAIGGMSIVVFGLSSVVGRSLVSSFVSFYESSPKSETKFLFSRFPPNSRSDMLGLDVFLLFVLSLPIIMR